MTPFVLLAALVLALVPLVIGIRRSTELFVIHIRHGEPRLVRGRLPQSLLDEITDVVRAPPVGAARLRVVRRSGQPSLSIRGDVDDAGAQRLRNVIHRYGVARIAAGGRRKR
jgi:uncharacterized protein DUF3634